MEFSQDQIDSLDSHPRSRHRRSQSHNSSIQFLYSRGNRGPVVEPASRGTISDFTIVQGIPNRNRGVTIGRKPKEPDSPYINPGPGYYLIKEDKKSKSGYSFGKASKLGSQEGERGFSRQSEIIEEYKGSKLRNMLSGWSFQKGKRNIGIVSQDLCSSPGPGHYSLGKDPTKAHGQAYSIPTSNFYDSFEDKSQPNTTLFSFNTTTNWTRGNFQKFSQLERFPTKGSTQFLRMVKKKGRMPVIEKNISEAFKYSPEIRSRQILKRKFQNSVKMRIAQETNEQIQNNHLEQALFRKTENERKKLIKKEQKNTYKIKQQWLLLTMLRGWSACLSSKYNLRKCTREKTKKYYKILYVCFLALGRILTRVKAFRERKLITIMRAITRVRMFHWRFKRRFKSKKAFAHFFSEWEISPTLVLFIKHIMYKIIMIQKWFRRYLTRKRLMLALMNVQWSAIEYALLKARNIPKTQRDKIICDCIKELQQSSIVPLPVRFKYIEQTLNTMNSNYFIELKKYKYKIELLQKEAQEKHDIKNIQNMLLEKPPEEFIFKPPPPPTFHLFIRRQLMIELISKAFTQRLEWDKLQ